MNIYGDHSKAAERTKLEIRSHERTFPPCPGIVRDNAKTPWKNRKKEEIKTGRLSVTSLKYSC